jgi:hypothetical protein
MKPGASDKRTGDKPVKGGPVKRKLVRDRLVNRWDWCAAGVMALLVIAIFHTFVFSDAMLFGTDMMPMGYMMRQVVADYWRANLSVPLWNPYILCGLPVVDAMHGDIFYPAALLYLLMPLGKALGLKILLHVWAAGMGMYVLLRVLRLTRRAAFFGGIAYMVAPYFLSLVYAGHDGKMFVTALFPLCVAALELLLRRPECIRAVAFGGMLGLLFLTTHPQMTYFAMWGLTIYLAFNVRRLVRSGVLRKGLIYLVAALVIGVAMGCIQFLPAYYYTANFSPRTGGVTFAFASSWSLHPEEIVSLLAPAFVGYSVGSVDSYWGRNPFKLNAESPGPLVLLLAIGGFVLLARRREAWPWLLLFIFCPLYALGAHTPLLKLAFYAIPGAKFLRAPSIIMFMFSCSSGVLAAYLVDGVLAGQIGRFEKRILEGLLALVVVILLLFTVGHGAFFGAWQGVFGKLDAEKLSTIAATAGALRADALLLAAFAGLALAVALSRYRTWRGGNLWIGVCILGTLATSLPHSTRFITYIDQYPALRNWLKPDSAIRYMLEDKDVFRVLPLTKSSFYNRNYLPIFGLQTANGFYDNRIRYYETLSSPTQENLIEPSIMSLTNIKYVITGGRVNHPSLVLERTFGETLVYRNKDFLPRAFIVHQAVVAASDSAALNIIRTPGFDPSATIVLAEGVPFLWQSPAGQVPAGEEWAKIETYSPGKVVVRAKAAGPGYLFFSENYLPYWKARVDGRPTDLVRCDVAMRAIPVEAGEHSIEMRYSSRWYAVGAALFIVSCLVVVAGVIGCLAWPRLRSKHA